MTWLPAVPHWLAWLGLALALALVPAPSTTALRARRLAAARRLGPDRASPPADVPGGDADRDSDRAGGSGPGGGRAAGRARWGRDSAVRLPAGRAAAMGAAVAGVLAGAPGGPVLGLAAAVLVATGMRTATVAAAARRERKRRAELLAAVRMLAAELDAGATPAAGFTAAAALAPAHRPVLLAAAAACHAGEDPATGSGSVGDGAAGSGPLLRSGAEYHGLAHAWRVAAATGAAPAAVLARLAGDLGARADQHRAVAAALAGARSSAVLLAGLPVLGIALGAAMQAHPLTVLFGTSSGRLLCLAGVILDAAGVLWTERLAARAERA